MPEGREAPHVDWPKATVGERPLVAESRTLVDGENSDLDNCNSHNRRGYPACSPASRVVDGYEHHCARRKTQHTALAFKSSSLGRNGADFAVRKLLAQP